MLRATEGALAHGFVACQIDLPPLVTGVSLLRWLQSLPPATLRLKGVVQFQEFPEKHFVFQRTDDAPTMPLIEPLLYSPTFEACAVLIGVGLDAERLRAEADKALARFAGVTAANT